jgi:hypothetical protein
MARKNEPVEAKRGLLSPLTPMAYAQQEAAALIQEYGARAGNERREAYHAWFGRTFHYFLWEQSGSESEEHAYVELCQETGRALGVYFTSARPGRRSWGTMRVMLVSRAGQRCTYCQRKGTAEKGWDGHAWHIDHMHPRALGGGDEEENLTLACRTCNIQKGTRRVEEFIPSVHAMKALNGR